jgi:hypothetical protein
VNDDSGATSPMLTVIASPTAAVNVQESSSPATEMAPL